MRIGGILAALLVVFAAMLVSVPTSLALCSKVYITVFSQLPDVSGNAYVTVSGVNYNDGQVFTMCSGSTVTISVGGIPSGYSFLGWLSSGGSFGSRTASTTTFTDSNSDSLIPVQQFSKVSGSYLTQKNWGGYTLHEAATSAQANFLLPSLTYNPGRSGSDSGAFWVGLGGTSVNDCPFWQSGVYVTVQSTGAVSLSTFYEYFDNNPSPCTNHGLVQNFTLTMSQGDNMFVHVWVDQTNLHPYALVLDVTTGASWSTHLNGYTLPANYKFPTEEWVDEAPTFCFSGQANHLTIPIFFHTWSNLGPQPIYGGLEKTFEYDGWDSNGYSTIIEPALMNQYLSGSGYSFTDSAGGQGPPWQYFSC